MSEITTILALDVGDRRVGLAVANSLARLPRALPTLQRDSSFWQRLKDVIINENIQQVVIGLPRSLEGQDTKQTQLTRDFVEQLKQHSATPLVFQDEALTSWQAEKELKDSKKPYTKGRVDALAATYILEDYLSEQYEGTKIHG